MEAPTTADTTTYYLVHRALRTGARRLATATSSLDRQDPRRTRALLSWCRGFIDELHCHHTIEDEAMFPALVARDPDAAALIERTDADHAAMDAILARMEAGMATLRGGGSPHDLHVSAEDLADLLDTHLAFEDAELIPRFERHFSGAEYQQLDDEAMEVLGITKQALFTVPFVLSAATAQEHQHLWASAPLPFKAIDVVCRRRHRRLTARALGRAGTSDREPVAAGR